VDRAAGTGRVDAGGARAALRPELLPGLAELVQRPRNLPLALHFGTVARSTARRLARVALWLTFLPFEARVAVDAAVRSLWRMLFSRRRMLEWQDGRGGRAAAVTGFAHVLRADVGGPDPGRRGSPALCSGGRPPGRPCAAGPVLLLWLGSPLVAWRGSAGRCGPGSARLGDGEVRLPAPASPGSPGATSRCSSRYRTTGCPPDNFQEQPSHRVAHRTSRRTSGWRWLSSLAAHDLGY